MIAPENKPEVILLGEDGNAFVVLAKTMKALRKAGADKEYVETYKREACAGDYDHLLQITMQYVDVC